MAEELQMKCQNCGQAYGLTAEYVAQYGGQTTSCQKCNSPITIPRAAGGGRPTVPPGAAAQPRQPVQPAQPEYPQQSPHPGYQHQAPGYPQGPAQPMGYPPRQGGAFDIVGFAMFRQLVTPLILPIAYWIGTAYIAYESVRAIIQSFSTGAYGIPREFRGMVSDHSSSFNFGLFLGGLVGLVFGLMLWRLLCESLMILFRINDNVSQNKKA